MGLQVFFRYKVIDKDGVSVGSDIAFTNATKKGEKFRTEGHMYHKPDWGDTISIEIV